MNSDLKITIEQKQARVPVTVFHIAGWLDAQSEPQFLEAARTAYDDGARFLLIDMNDLDTLTSAGMRAIQKVYRLYTPNTADNRFPHLKMSSAPPQVYHALKIAGFLQSIPMYESVQSALDSFEKPPG